MARLASCCRRQAAERSTTRMPCASALRRPLARLLVGRGEEEELDAFALELVQVEGDDAERRRRWAGRRAAGGGW